MSGAHGHSPWREYLPRLEQLAARLGLDYQPVDFEPVPDSFMMEIAYGFLVRMPHWLACATSAS
jgi:stage V sporulation protein R